MKKNFLVFFLIPGFYAQYIPIFKYDAMKKLYFGNYHDKNIFQSNHSFFEFTPISDDTLLYRATFHKNTQVVIEKGQLLVNPIIRNETCFNVIPPVQNISQLCICELGGSNANFILWTNLKKQFFYGMVSDLMYTQTLYDHILYYNQTPVSNIDSLYLY